MAIKRTDPRNRTAPLPEGTEIAIPTMAETDGEIARAATELVWALHKHRAAWTKMEALKASYDARGQEFKDNERAWKLAVGDVQWWRGEVNCRSNSMQALLALAASRPRAIVNRVIRDEPSESLNVRETVLGYPGNRPPNEAEVSCARAWLNVVGASMTSQGRFARPSDWAACTNLLRAHQNYQAT